MALCSRVRRLEKAKGGCPVCGDRKPIKLLYASALGPLADVAEHATAEERAAVDQVVATVYARSKVQAAGLDWPAVDAGGESACPKCGRPTPIRTIVYVDPAPAWVAVVAEHGTPAEREDLERLAAAIGDRAGVAVTIDWPAEPTPAAADDD